MTTDFSTASRNPFHVLDAPDPDGEDVVEFASTVRLSGSADDPNAAAWNGASSNDIESSLRGNWSSRWNGGVDPTIVDDSLDYWKSGQAEVLEVDGRIYIRFDWDGGRRHALLDVRRLDETRLSGRYLNLSNPAISRPWVGRVVDVHRIDGMWTNGRLDFRR